MEITAEQFFPFQRNGLIIGMQGGFKLLHFRILFHEIFVAWAIRFNDVHPLFFLYFLLFEHCVEKAIVVWDDEVLGKEHHDGEVQKNGVSGGSGEEKGEKRGGERRLELERRIGQKKRRQG